MGLRPDSRPPTRDQATHWFFIAFICGIGFADPHAMCMQRAHGSDAYGYKYGGARQKFLPMAFGGVWWRLAALGGVCEEK